MSSIDNIKNIDDKDMTNFDIQLFRLRRSYKATCPLRCGLGLSESYNPMIREVLHPECEKSLIIIQLYWRKKAKLRKITSLDEKY